MPEVLQIILQIFLGVALAAVCGYRIFVPLLVMGIAGLAGYIQFAPGFEWICSYPAILIFSIATILEIVGYFIPHVDNFLNVISLPVGAIAGVIVAASVISDMDPMLKWTLAIIAGGGAATLTGLLSNGAHQVSTAVSAGIANPVVSTFESVGTVAASVLSIAAPVLAVVILLVFVVLSILLFKQIKRRKRKKLEKASA